MSYTTNWGRNSNRMRRRRNANATVAFVIFLVIVIGGVGCGAYVNYATREDVTFRVTDKQIKREDNKDVYMVFTDHGVYQDKDTVWYFKWNSSDLFAKLHEGESYTCTTVGMRIPLFSKYRNLIDCKEVS